MKLITLVFTLVFISLSYAEKPTLDYYLSPQIVFDESTSFDPDVPTPESVLGYQVGDWHVRPEQIAEYMYALASTSKRVWVEETGRTWEQRPLMLVAFSSEQNITNLDKIRTNHLNLQSRSNGSPGIAWMGYSVHGDEASGSNTALLLAYYLAAAQGPKVNNFLSNNVVLIDPMLNPDGLARFSTWVNSRKSMHTVSDPNDVEHNEPWPTGRTNHFWFDLNRDWLLAQHPESRARLNYFHQWLPLVVTDFHEMGSNNSYFFQPGVPSRNNPITPQKNFDLTAKIADYHSKAFDSIGSFYYSKESFDDFYYGKGSTYPDVNGSIGILFEQASAAGHRIDTVNGDLTFPFAIRNHLAASFSTLKAIHNEKISLMNYQKEFFQSALKQADDYKFDAFVFDAAGDNTRLMAFLNILQQHKIKFHALSRDLKVDGKIYKASEAFIVPVEQKQFRLIRAMFETQTSFNDNTFYDVSSWTLPLAFNLRFTGLDRGDFSSRLIGKAGIPSLDQNVFVLGEKTVALAIDWRDFDAAKLVHRLQNRGLRLKVATKAAEYLTQRSSQKFEAGTVFLPIGSQSVPRQDIAYAVGDALKGLRTPVIQVTSGLAQSGIDLGSPSMRSLAQPKPIMVVGDGVYSYEAGELWHLFDQRIEMPIVKVTAQKLASLSLDDYTHLYLVSGRYDFSDELVEKLQSWIKQGGNLIVSRTAGRWLSKQSWSPVTLVSDSEDKNQALAYSERDRFLSDQIIGGAIFQLTVDRSHPLGFGLHQSTLPVFRRGTDYYQVEDEPFVTVASYTDSPLISGYASQENQKKIAGTPAIVAAREGKGSVVLFADNMNFRAFWWGTSKLFLNSLYFNYAYNSRAGE